MRQGKLTRALLGGIVDFETFSKVLNRPGGFREPGEPEEYCRGFQVFDKDMSGFIGVGQLRYILTNLGEKMSDDEVDELLKAVDTSSGEINYTGKPALIHFRPQILTWPQISSERSSRTKHQFPEGCGRSRCGQGHTSIASLVYNLGMVRRQWIAQAGVLS